MLLIAGLVLMLLGLISGAGIVASSIGMLSVTHDLTLWIMFPAGSFLGLILAALGSRTSAITMLMRLSGALMLILALGSIAVLVLGSMGLLPEPRTFAPLWYVFGVGLFAGASGFLASARPGQPA